MLHAPSDSPVLKDALGPVRLRWLAALPAGTGLLMALASFATSDDD